MTKDEAYFTYAHYRASDQSIFYIGKGKRDRVVAKVNRNNYWHNTVNKHGIFIERLAKWKTEKEAFLHEKFLILCFKDIGAKLVNMTEGGEGTSNPSEEVRAKMRANNAMKRPEVARKISEARKGKLLSIEHREKLSKVQIGKKLSEATRKKMSDGLIHRLTPEYRNKLSESAKKAWAKRKGLL